MHEPYVSVAYVYINSLLDNVQLARRTAGPVLGTTPPTNSSALSASTATRKLTTALATVRVLHIYTRFP